MELLPIFVINKQYLFSVLVIIFSKMRIFSFIPWIIFSGTSNYFSNVYWELFFHWAENYFSRYREVIFEPTMLCWRCSCSGLVRVFGRFPFTPKFWKFWLVHQRDRTISVWSDRDTRDQLWRWSTLTGLVISVGRTRMSLSICQNCCPQYCTFVSCLHQQVVSNAKWIAVSKAWHLKLSLNQLQFLSIFDICL